MTSRSRLSLPYTQALHDVPRYPGPARGQARKGTQTRSLVPPTAPHAPAATASTNSYPLHPARRWYNRGGARRVWCRCGWGVGAHRTHSGVRWTYLSVSASRRLMQWQWHWLIQFIPHQRDGEALCGPWGPWARSMCVYVYVYVCVCVVRGVLNIWLRCPSLSRYHVLPSLSLSLLSSLPIPAPEPLSLSLSTPSRNTRPSPFHPSPSHSSRARPSPPFPHP